MRKAAATDPGRDPLARPGRRRGRLRRRPRLRPRHQRAGPPRGRAARQRGALPLGHPVVAGPDLGDEPPGPLRVRLGPRPRPAGLGARGGPGPPVPRVHRRGVGGRRPTTSGRGWRRSRASRRPSGSTSATATAGSRPFEVSSVAVVREGDVENVYGIARDVAERGAPGARAARQRGALPVPRRELAGRHLRDRRGGGHHLLLGVGGAHARLDARGGRRPPLPGHRPHRRRGRPSGRRFGELARGPPGPHDAHGAAGEGRRLPAVRGHGRGDAHRRRVLGRPRLRPRHPRARAPRGRAARVRGALPLPRPVLAGPRLGHRRRGPVHVRLRPGASSSWAGRPRSSSAARSSSSPPPGGTRATLARFRWLQRRPTQAHRSRLRRAHPRRARARDGDHRASACSPRTARSSGAHGAARDVSDRERLECGLRRQAAELASSEERAHLARELHDSVTQALFSMTLISRSIELLLERDPAAVPAKLASLRDLQREALAEMRALIFELRPGNVEEHGLMQALRTHSASLSGPDRAAGRRRGRARRAARRSRSRRRSTGSPRRRSTTSSSTPAPARSGSTSPACARASRCG